MSECSSTPNVHSDGYSGIALDISNYTGRLSGEWIDLAKDNGVGLVIVRLSTEDGGDQRSIAAQQVAALVEHGMPWQGYLWCYWGDSPATLWGRAQERLPGGWPGYFGETIWLDAEDPTKDGQDPLDFLLNYGDLVANEGFMRGVYTSDGWWRGNVRNSLREQKRLMAGWSCWPAQWGTVRECGDFRPFGPFTSSPLLQTGGLPPDARLGQVDMNIACGVW